MYSYFSHLQSFLHLMRYIYRDFFPLLRSFWTHRFRCFVALLLLFVSPLPHLQYVTLWGLFSSRETNKKSHLGWDSVNREGGTWGSWGLCWVLAKNCWTLREVWTGAHVSHPAWNEQTHWKNLQKKTQWGRNATSHNNTSWYTDTDGFLEHSLSKESLYYKGPPSRR